MPQDSTTALPRILSRSGPLPAQLALDGEPLQPGRIHVAPADRHLLLLDGRMRLSRGPAENGPRPAVDHCSAPRPEPQHVVPATGLGPLLERLAAEPVAETAAPVALDERLDGEVAIAGLADITTDQITDMASGYGCPTCGGALFELADQPVPRYRCRVGHAWSPSSLLEEHAIATEGALWTAPGSTCSPAETP